MFIDSHCHIDGTAYDRFLEGREIFHPPAFYNPEAILSRAKKANVQILLTIGTQISDIDEMSKIVDSYNEIFMTVGIHPEYAKEHLQKFSKEEIQQLFEECCKSKKTVGIGEIGLDYFTNKDIDEQKDLFDFQLSLAEQFKLPVSIHTRESWIDTMDLIEVHRDTRGIIHCFSGEENLAKRAIDADYLLGIGGVVTFKNSLALQEAVKWIPLESIVLETDAPWLAPVPFRGKVNEPSFIPNIAEKIAEIKCVSIEKVEEITTKNFLKLFKKIELGDLGE